MRSPYVMLVCAVLSASAAQAQGWSPQRNVELVVGFVAGGGMDRTARSLDRILVSHKFVTSGVSVVNKPGGSSNVAYTYTSQRPADGHTV
jgi:putative tricarboxylic transport membrane protein